MQLEQKWYPEHIWEDFVHNHRDLVTFSKTIPTSTFRHLFTKKEWNTMPIVSIALVEKEEIGMLLIHPDRPSHLVEASKLLYIHPSIRDIFEQECGCFAMEEEPSEKTCDLTVLGNSILMEYKEKEES